MPIAVKMPKGSDTMTEGVLAAWRVQPGNPVKEGDNIADIETDKAVMPVECFDVGTMAAHVVAEGQTAAVGAVIALLAGPGEDWQTVAKSAGQASAAPTAPPPPAKGTADAPSSDAPTAPTAPAAPGAPAEAPAEPGRLRASPLARKIAREAGIDLAGVAGSGPQGRIVQADVLAARAAQPTGKSAPTPTPAAPAPRSAPAADTVVKLAGVRAVIARRLLESKTTIPHFYVEMDLDAAGLIAARDALKAALPDQKFTYNDFVVKAVALCLRKHPALNGSFQGDKIIHYGRVDVGMGVAIDGGLVVPVIRSADQLSLGQIAAESRRLVDRAKTRALKPEEMTGSTFTISNMGMFGVSRFSAIVNPPEAGILAVGAIREEPVVRAGAVVPGARMAVTLSADHRVVDGAAAAMFLADLRRLLEHPMAMIV